MPRKHQADVYAHSKGNHHTETNNHRMCAERRLIDAMVTDAYKHGIKRHSIVTWVRRKLGGEIEVVRLRRDGTPSCSIPCIFCRRALITFDIKLTCCTDFTGELTFCGPASEAPPSGFTSGQKRMLFKHL